MPYQGALCGERILRVARQAEALADAEDVRVDGHRGSVPHHGQHDVGRLAPYAGQLHQRVQVRGYLAAEVVDEHARRLQQRAGLVVGEGDATDVFVDLFLGGRGQLVWGGVGLEQRRSDDVDALVGALRRQDHGQQQ